MGWGGGRPGGRWYRGPCSRAGETGRTLEIGVTWGTEESGRTGRTEGVRGARGAGVGRGRAVAAGSVIRGGRFATAIAARPGPAPPLPRGLPASASPPLPPSPSPPSSLPPPPGAAARRCRGESAVAKGGAALYPAAAPRQAPPQLH